MFSLQSNYFILVYGFLCILLLTIVLEYSIKKKKIKHNTGRKILHFGAILICAYTIQTTHFRSLLSYIFLFSSIALFIVVKKKWLSVQTNNSYGIALFPLAFFVLLQLHFLSTKEIVFAVTTLAVSDALASIIGEYFGKQKIVFLFEEKTWFGAFVFYITTLILAAYFFHEQNFSIIFYALAAIIPTCSELFSYKGSDNFTIPIFSAIWLHLINSIEPSQLNVLALELLVIIVAAALTVYKRWLTNTGATAAVCLGTFIIATNQLAYFVTPLTFFALGSILTKITSKQKKQQGRNAIQVFANGIIGIICLLIYQLSNETAFLYAFIASFTISMADTISSEIGNFFKGKTIDILTLKPIEKGLSGGISWQGTMAALLASICIVYITQLFIHLPVTIALSLILCGWIGMFVDSLLGSLLQVKYIYNNQVTETCYENAVIKSGFAWCDNNVVNILSNLITTVAFLILNL